MGKLPFNPPKICKVCGGWTYKDLSLTRKKCDCKKPTSENSVLNLCGVSGSTCPKCGCSDYEEWQEQEYEYGGDDPMYGGKLIWVKMTRCGNCD